MKIERAIEILNPEHREHYESIEPVNEACRMGMQALEKQIPKKPNIHGFREGREINTISFTCPNCNKHIGRDNYCKHCGQALDWSDTECKK